MSKKTAKILYAILALSVLAIIVFSAAFLYGEGRKTDETQGISELTSIFEGQSEISAEVNESSEECPAVTTPEDTKVHFLVCPDNIVHSSVFYNAIEAAADKNGVKPAYSPLEKQEYDFSGMYKNVASEIEAADISFINVETLIGGDKYGISSYPMFNSPEAMGDCLVSLGFDVYNICHNHMLDSANDKYLKGCNEFFTSKGLMTLGYYADESETENIPIYECKGIKIAMLAYTYGTNGIQLPSSSTTVIPYLNEKLIRKQVAIAKEKADIVIVFPHWGEENNLIQNTKSDYFGQKYAKLFAELEVDMVIGMHPHVIQTCEWIETPSGKKTFVAYSLGNFVSGMTDSYNNLGGMLAFDIIRNGETEEISIENIIFKPTVTHSTAGPRKAGKDTGYRDMEIYYLYDYTDELAKLHHSAEYEKAKGKTLVGPDNKIYGNKGNGALNKDNLVRTVKKIIPEEFLEEYYINYEFAS